MKKQIAKLIKNPLEHFVHMESSSSILLGVAALMAVVFANAAADTYFGVLNTQIFGLSLQHWINDGLMAVFFFMVGLEIKKEIVIGELSTVRKAALPVAAAIGGMVVPALIYVYFNQGKSSLSGWAVPMATDIAFALGVLMFFKSKIPLSLKIFLLALAIVDDLGAVLVIALIYTKGIKLTGVAIAVLAFLFILMGRRFNFRSYSVYLFLGVLSWIGVFYSGIHATVAGVILGLLTPVYFPNESGDAVYSPVDELIHRLHPWVSFGIMPVFALANAGVSLQGVQFQEVIASPVSLGVFAGLVLGKPLGILMASVITVWTGMASLPEGANWKSMASVACLAGIGFTMSIFITDLALTEKEALLSKVAIIAASLVASIAGFSGMSLITHKVR